MHTNVVVVILFAIATAVALLARRLKLPYTAALVVAGVLIGAGKWVAAPHLSKDLLFALFLPALIFEAAFHIRARQFWANKLTIFGLAVPGWSLRSRRPHSFSGRRCVPCIWNTTFG